MPSFILSLYVVDDNNDYKDGKDNNADVKVRTMMIVTELLLLLLLLLLKFPSLISQFKSTIVNYCINPALHRYNKNLFVKFRFFKYFLSFM